MPPLSIVIGTTQPWPEIRATLDSLFEQARACGAEIVVADRTGQGLPVDVAERYPGLVWLKRPGASIFALRGAAMARATGDLVATTEDHCRVAPDWCANIIRAHAAHPEAGAIGGSVANGCPRNMRDWAHHFVTFGPAVPPIDETGRQPLWSGANIAYKRGVLPCPIPDEGLVDMFFIRDLRARGEKLVADASLQVAHHQPLPLRTCCTYHFHNGRTIAAARLPRLSVIGRLARLLACGILPLYLIGLRIKHVWPKRTLRGKLLASLPWIAAYVTAHSSGELVGYLAGGGSSALKLH